MKKLLLALALLASLLLPASGHAQIGGGAIPSTLPTVSPAINCNGTTDNAPAIQAAITQSEALSPSGAVIQLPPCNQIAIATNLLVNNSNIYIRGTGGGGVTGVTGTTSGYVGVAFATSVLKWTGAIGGTMITFDPAAGGQSIKGGGLFDLVLAGMNGGSTTGAAICLDQRSTQNFQVNKVVFENCSTTGWNQTTTANSLVANEVLDVQNGWANEIVISQIGAGVDAAQCLTMDTTSTTANISHNLYGDIACRHRAGTGVFLGNTDSNTFLHTKFFVPGGSSGKDMVLAAGTQAALTARDNIFVDFYPSLNGTGVQAQGTETSTVASRRNRIINYDVSNAVAGSTPTLGTNGTETPVAWFTTNEGITNLGQETSDNYLINGDFRIDQRHEFAGALSMGNSSNAVSYCMDRWKFLIAGLTLKVSCVGQASGPLGAKSRQMHIAVVSQTAPAAANTLEACQSIEGFSLVDTFFGTSSAKSLVLGFWFQSSVTGTFSGSLSSNTTFTGRMYPISWSVPAANTWQYYSFVIPGDTTGTWNLETNLAALTVCFDMGAGSNFQGTGVNAWGTNEFLEQTGAVQLVNQVNGSSVDIAMVRLRKGKADLPWVARPYAQELIIAQRYFAKTFPQGTAPAQNAGVTGALFMKNPIALGDPGRAWQFPVTMLSPPTVTTYNPSAANANWRDVTAAGDATVSLDPGTSASDKEVFIATSGTVATLGDLLAIHVSADPDY
jgi:hypothetical protein